MPVRISATGPKIYLCGPINGCTNEDATGWRDMAKSLISGACFVDPMIRDYRDAESENYREIVELDKRDIAGCDLVLVMYSRPSVGTSMEVLHAWNLGVPVLVIYESGQPISPWLMYHSTAIVDTLEDAATKIKRWL